ncbi:MAG: serine/threonine protein kinase/ligand-binding sensor domain-containing protein [Cellvibrionaceae bacterium]|jgi:serine/threonine protein kinase/ligand-binding sensor domain-containing protein
MTPERIEHYRIIREVSKEKYATVFEAEEEGSDQLVHLRLYSGDFFAGEAILTEFKNYAAALAQMNNPAVLPIYHYGSYKDRPYTVSPVMAGGSLEQMLAAGTKLEPSEVALIAERVAIVLDELHKQKIVHGNITPDVIWFNDEGIAYLGGFLTSTPPLALMADLSWYSPESLNAKDLIRQSDSYSLTVLLYRMLTGATPFAGKTANEIGYLLLQNQVPSVGAYIDQNVEELDAFLGIGMEYVHLKRPIFATELVNRFKYIFQISTPLDLTDTQAHRLMAEQEVEVTSIPESNVTADFEDNPEWMFVFGIYEAKTHQPKAVSQRKPNRNNAVNVPDIDTKPTKVGRNRTLAIAGILLGLIAVVGFGAITLFGVTLSNLFRPSEAGIGVTPFADEGPSENDLTAVAETITSTSIIEGGGIVSESIASLVIDIPVASLTASAPSTYTWASLPPSRSFLRASSTGGFTTDDAGWYMFSNANTIRDVVRVGDLIYAASGAGLTIWNIDNGQPTHLTSYDGLVSNDINQIIYCELPEPKLIIASESGVGILDLETLENEILDVAGRQLVNNQVSSVACENGAESTKLYVGYAKEGLTIHDLASGERDRIDRSDGLPTNSVDQILLVDGVVWINTGSSLLKFDQATRETTLLSKAEGTLPVQNISKMAWDSSGTGLVWMATNDGLVVGNRGDGFEFYTPDNTNLPSGLGESVSIDPDGLVWYGTSLGNICAFDPISLSCLQIYHHPATGLQFEGAIAALDVSAGQLVYGHRQDGLRLGTFAESIGPDGSIQVASWQAFVLPNQFPINDITSLAESDGFVWIGTRKGLYKAPVDQLSGEGWEYLDIQNSILPANWITDLFADPQGGMWVGTSRGAVYFGTVWLNEPILTDQQIRAIVQDGRDENIWIGTREGLFQYDGRVAVAMSDLPEINVRTLKWVEGDLFIGLEDGRLGVLTGGFFNTFNRSNSPLSSDPIAALETGPNQTLYVGNGGNLFQLVDDRATLVQIPEVQGFYISDVLFQERSGETLVSTMSHSLFYNDSTEWRQMTVRNGLPSERIIEMMIDSRGTLWLAGHSLNKNGGGLVRYVPYPVQTITQ